MKTATILALCIGNKNLVFSSNNSGGEQTHLLNAVKLLNHPESVRIITSNINRYTPEQIRYGEDIASEIMDAKVEIISVPKLFQPKHISSFAIYGPYDLISADTCMTGAAMWRHNITDEDLVNKKYTRKQLAYAMSQFQWWDLFGVKALASMMALLRPNGYFTVWKIFETGIIDPEIIKPGMSQYDYITKNKGRIVMIARDEHFEAFVKWDEKVMYHGKLQTPAEILGLSQPRKLNDKTIYFKKLKRVRPKLRN